MCVYLSEYMLSVKIECRPLFAVDTISGVEHCSVVKHCIIVEPSLTVEPGTTIKSGTAVEPRLAVDPGTTTIMPNITVKQSIRVKSKRDVHDISLSCPASLSNPKQMFRKASLLWVNNLTVLLPLLLDLPVTLAFKILLSTSLVLWYWRIYPWLIDLYFPRQLGLFILRWARFTDKPRLDCSPPEFWISAKLRCEDSPSLLKMVVGKTVDELCSILRTMVELFINEGVQVQLLSSDYSSTLNTQSLNHANLPDASSWLELVRWASQNTQHQLFHCLSLPK